ncbi:MAG: transcription-repair coupling factor [Spirochaetia bacterium]|nr:transcription-repair coupling factor [Spirochaetia bacterium]
MTAFLLAEYLASKKARPCVVVVSGEREAQDFALDLKAANELIEVWSLPWWGTVPYRTVPLAAPVFGQRASALAALASMNQWQQDEGNLPPVFVVTQRALQTPVPPPEYIRSLLFSLKVKDSFDPTALAARLVEQGYLRVPRVTVRGEFTLRGEVLDIFLPGDEVAHRIVFDFDQIEHIKTFDPESQNSLEEVESLVVYPMKEVIWTEELIHQLEARLEEADFQLPKGAASNALSNDTGDFGISSQEEFQRGKDKLLDELRNQKESEGEELFYQEVFDRPYSVMDYLDASTPLFYLDHDRLTNAQESFDREYMGMYRKVRSLQPVPPPDHILFTFHRLVELHPRRILFRTLHTQLSSEAADIVSIKLEMDPPRSFFGNIQYLKESFTNLIEDNWQIFIYGDSENQAQRISELLKDLNQEKLHVLSQSISAGFGIPQLKVLVVQENEIFGRRKRVPKSVKQVKSAVIDTFVELNPGDFVVHVNYGIGLFKGIERVKAMGNERDYIKLEYAEEETLFIPIEQVNLVQRYIGNEGVAPRLDRIGSKSWENRKNKAKKAAEDIAQKLIDLYSRRKASRGFPFPKDAEWQTAFEAAFPYTETEDQLTVTAEIKADMEKPEPMDRLVCGDVGYGKTEIAMRAAFKAVMGGKQVAFLAPTTILAEQHYENCVERFEGFPVRIAHMSRFVSRQEQKKILEGLSTGAVDILVGTHRIIQKDVIFKDLGLMIIDEEQRFGVKDKERLKVMKNNIDSLAMSATPIPRTLHMSLLKIRDMSLLTTPPHNRQPIETVIDAYNDDRVTMAIRREAERGGQVFYLHNRVESLEEVRFRLQNLVPEMMVETAHGQMTATELDDIFRRFKLGGFQILVSTTIIENGIDIPNVNTIIIDRADMYGVSQLYQLRGRVGRSDRKAYAYLLYPENKVLSEVAMKRLQVISDFTELGSGFKIAMKDMEIRGAGNLLGKDQSGEIFAVGFDLYLKLLEEAVQRLTDENFQAQNEVLLELEYSGFIPESYITNPQTKMEVYKKIASISERETLERMYGELEDRFGPIPEEVYSLLSLAEIRIICRRLSIATLRERGGMVTVEFARVSDVSVDKVLRLMKEGGGRVKLDAKRPNVLLLETGKIGLKEKSEFIREKLEMLVS